MRFPLKYLCVIGLAVLSLWGLIPSPEAGAVNKAYDFKLLQGKNPLLFAVLLDDAPRYSLKPIQKNRLQLAFSDTTATPQLRQRDGEDPGEVSFEEKPASTSLVFQIPLKGAPREIETSWLPEAGIFLVGVKWADTQEVPEKPAKKPPILQNLRFGIQEGYTRMVVDVDQKPQWELIRREKDRTTLDFQPGGVAFERGSFKGLPRIREVVVNKGEGHVALDLALDSSSDHVKVFWLDTGSKLVLDIFDRPLPLKEEALRLTRRKEAPQAQEKTPEVEPQDSPSQTATVEDVQPEVPEKEGVPTGETGPRGAAFVRMKIPMPGPPGDSGDAKENAPAPVIHPVNILIEPEMDPTQPETMVNREWVHNLSSEEAFLVGRIQEAWETKAFEKGAELMEQFLARFPDSPLNESLSFLIGDFRLALLKMGERDAFPAVTNSYKNAVNRFGHSGRVGKTYVRLGQAHAYMGKDYEALGYLNMAIAQYREGDHLPMAYLTRGRVYLRMNQPDKAIEDLKTVSARFPQSKAAENARYEVARYFYSIGSYPEVEKRLKGLLEDLPDFYLEYPEVLSLMAGTKFYLKDYDGAREYYFKAANLGHQPESVDLLLTHIGDTYYHQSKEREAEKFYRLVIEQDPESEGASIARLRLADKASDVNLFKEVHEKNQNTPIGDLALLSMAKRLYEQKQYTMAMDTLVKIMENPNQLEIQDKAGQLYVSAVEGEIKELYRAGEYGKVVALRQSGSLPRPVKIDPEANLLVAQSYFQLQQYGEAIPLFESIKPYDLSTASKGFYFQNISECYMKEGDEQRAIEVIEEGRKARLGLEDEQKITLMLADLFREKADLGKAYDLYESLVKGKRTLSDQEIARIYLSMGQISNMERRYPRAREALNRCIELAEKSRKDLDLLQRAYVETGNGYHREGNHRTAVISYQKAMDLGYGPEKKDYWETCYRLALSYLDTGDTGAAENLFTAIAEEGDPLLQQKVQIKMGTMALEKQIKRLSIPTERGEATL